MKQTITALILCIALTVAGQESEQPKDTKEWAFNVILVPNLLLGGNADFQNTMNLISYKSIKENGNAFRLGFGGFYKTGRRESTHFTISLSMGQEKQRKISPHWITSIGIDIPFKYSQLDCLNSPPGSIPCKFLDVGFGGVWGIQWMINQHVGIRTEGGVYYNYLQSRGEDEFFNHSLKFVLPRSLYLGVRF